MNTLEFRRFAPEHDPVEEDERQQLDEEVDDQEGAVAQESDEPRGLPRLPLINQRLGIRNPPDAGTHAQHLQNDLHRPHHLAL